MTTDSTEVGKKEKILCVASLEGIERAKKALIRLGFESQSNFAKSQLLSRSTVTKFFTRQPIQPDSFERICEKLKLNQEIIGFEIHQGITQSGPYTYLLPIRPKARLGKTFSTIYHIKRDEIDKLLTFEEILAYGIARIKLPDDYFFKRISELKELCASEEDYDLSLESLKTMFLFIGAMGSISKPSSLTVSETGLFYLAWEKDRNNSITVRFKTDYFLDYVICKPSLYIDKRIVFNGSMYALDFIDYLHDVNLKIHQQL